MSIKITDNKIKSLTLFLIIFTFSCKLFANDDLVWSYQYTVLTVASDAKRRPMLSILNSAGRKLDPRLADTVAELLLSQVNDAKTKDDGLNWYGRVLSNTKKSRYRNTLQEVIDTTESGEVKERAEKYFKKLKKDKKEPQYSKGSIDIPATLQQYSINSENAWPKNKTLQIGDLSRRASIYEVFNTLGRPQHVTTGRIEGLLVIKLYLYYRGVGRIEFKYRKKQKAWRLVDIIDDPLAFDLELPHHKINEDGSQNDINILMAMLLDDGPRASRGSLTQQFYAKNVHQEFLDTAAEILISEFKTNTIRGRTDIYAWICRLLAEKGGSRYQNILATVARESTILKLANYANTPIKPNGSANVSREDYQPGSINLDQQKQKYPSPYQ